MKKQRDPYSTAFKARGIPFLILAVSLLSFCYLLLSPALGASGPAIDSLESPTHPDENIWYSSSNPSFNWSSFGLQLTGSYNTPGSAYDVAVSENYAYVADYGSGLRIIDVSNPAAPTPVGFYDTTGYAYSVAVSGNYAYVADGNPGLQIIDISNPAAPSLVGSFDTLNARGVFVSGNYAYVADYGSGLRIIDISDPAAPTSTGSLGNMGYAYGVTVSGNYAYVAAYDSGLRIIDVSNPAAPSPKSFYLTPGNAYDVAVSGNYAYVAAYGSGLQVINISNPSAPALAGSYDTPGSAYGVAVSVAGNYAYVGDGASGLQVIDVSNPAAPVLAGSYDTPGSSWGVAISGTYAYVADRASGLLIFKLSGPASYSYVLDQNADTVPDTVVDGTEATASYSGVSDGEWYFHVSAVDAAGNWGPAAHRRIRIATCDEGQPPLSLSRLNAFWASYADYTARKLSVNFRIADSSAPAAANVAMVGTTNTNGVTLATPAPMAVGDISAGASTQVTLVYNIPAGVTSFKTTVYSTAQNACGNSFYYPEAYPGT